MIFTIYIKTMIQAFRFYINNKDFLIDIYIKRQFTEKPKLMTILPLWVGNLFSNVKAWLFGNKSETTTFEGTNIT